MRKAILCGIICMVLAIPVKSFSDFSDPLSAHLNKIKESYAKKDYNTVISEACRALYHKRQKALVYNYLALGYENTGSLAFSLISYVKYGEYCDDSNKKKLASKIEELMSKIDKNDFDKMTEKIPKKALLLKEESYKRNKLYRIRDYIYNPAGQIIEEKYCRPDSSFEHLIKYIYDDNGNLKEKDFFDSNMKKERSESYIYEYGQLVQVTKINPNGEVTEKIVYKYDLDSNIKSIHRYAKNNEMISKKNFMYNKNNLFEESSTDYLNPASSENYTTKYLYKQGLLDEKATEYRLGLVEKVKYKHNSKVLNEEIYYNEGGIPIRSKKYEYLPNGNIQKIAEYQIYRSKKYVLETKIDFDYINL